ncbi:MAG: hypothetical protein ACRDRW_14680 [Pseudonocardiaceae bacterium]
MGQTHSRELDKADLNRPENVGDVEFTDSADGFGLTAGFLL